MGRFRDLTGQTFNDLKALKKVRTKKSGDAVWRCTCLRCGDDYELTANELTSGKRKACPKHSSTALRDIIGERFGSVVVLRRATDEEADGHVGNNVGWLVRCDATAGGERPCGRERVVTQTSLRNGRVKSCGCENARRHTKHGAFRGLYGSARAKNGSKEYKIFQGIAQRCSNERSRDYPRYGGAGIKCEFNSFKEFNASLGPCPPEKSSVDRIDPNGNYAPGNVRWADASEQANNRRNNVVIACFGRCQTLSQWAREVGITPRALSIRLEKHRVEVALTLPKNAHARGSRDGYEPVRRFAFHGRECSVKQLSTTKEAVANGIDEQLIWSRINAARERGEQQPDGDWLIRPKRITRRSRTRTAKMAA
jgi:hypothetical protein